MDGETKNDFKEWLSSLFYSEVHQYEIFHVFKFHTVPKKENWISKGKRGTED